jgi:hypothetical protein
MSVLRSDGLQRQMCMTFFGPSYVPRDWQRGTGKAEQRRIWSPGSALEPQKVPEPWRKQVRFNRYPWMSLAVIPDAPPCHHPIQLLSNTHVSTSVKECVYRFSFKSETNMQEDSLYLNSMSLCCNSIGTKIAVPYKVV